jgi:hypothetical protein
MGEPMSQLTIAEKQNFIERLNQIDFGPIAFKLMNPEDGAVLSIDRVTISIEQYRQFLLLNYLYPERAIVPSQMIDKVWHTHILDTAKYREDCQLLFDRFMDHWPYFGMTDAADRQSLNTAFSETQVLWMQHFGEKM